jgi:hypothetical protein
LPRPPWAREQSTQSDHPKGWPYRLTSSSIPSFHKKGADSWPPPGIDRGMKAAVYTKTKSGKVLRITDVETPIPKDNEVLIKTRVASVNPLDWRLKSRRPGVDVAGEVVAVGKRVTQFKPGDAVFGTCRGAFAEYACTSESALVSKPVNLTFEQAACVPIAGLTALQALRDKGDLQPGQKVLINGDTLSSPRTHAGCARVPGVTKSPSTCPALKP